MPIVDRGDTHISWDSDGQGTPVLLINGLGSPAAVWYRLAPRLAADHRVLCFDNRGTGASGVPDGVYTVEAMAADAAAVLDAAGVASAHVVGHSMGGLIAQELALSCPARVASLVLAGTHVGLPHAASLGPAGLPDPAVPAALAAGATLPPAERMASLRPLIYAETTPVERIQQDEAVRNTQPTSERGFSAQLLGVQPWERLAELGSLQLPTLVLHGDEDRLVPLAHARRLKAAIPTARLHIVAHAGHELFTDQELAAAGAICAFLNDVDGRLAETRTAGSAG